MAASLSVGYAAADSVDPSVQERGNADTYAVEQGGDCVEISPVTGDDSVKSFYDYRTPFADNPSTNATGQSYSSEGTTALQRPNTSTLFLYRNDTGTLSLVFLHGATDNASAGGSITFDITGLPEDGTWAVKDDEYQGESNYDNWSHGPGTTQVNWTWGEGKTDGGAYAGLGDDFNVTIDPAFNRRAALYGEYYNGTVENWTVLSNGAGNYHRTQLDMSRPVTISSGGCDDARGAADGADDDANDGDAPAIGDGVSEDDSDETEPPTDGDDVAGANDTETDDNETEPDDNETEANENETDPGDNVTDPGDNGTDIDGNDTDDGDNETDIDGNETDGTDNETGTNGTSGDVGDGNASEGTNGSSPEDDGATGGSPDSSNDETDEGAAADDDGSSTDDGSEPVEDDGDGADDDTSANDDDSPADGADDDSPVDESGDTTDGVTDGNKSNP